MSAIALMTSMISWSGTLWLAAAKKRIGQLHLLSIRDCIRAGCDVHRHLTARIKWNLCDRRPFSRRRKRPIFAGWRRTQTLPESPARRQVQSVKFQGAKFQGVASRGAADRAGAGRAVEPCDQPRRKRHRLVHRIAAAAGQFVGPPRRRRSRRASRPRVDARDQRRCGEAGYRHERR